MIEPEPPAQVLIIDDDRMSQMVLTRNLRQAGYVVDAAGGGADGLARLRAGAFDLVILDFLMPDMDGYEVLSHIRADERLRELPVVLVSGVNDTANAATLVEAGADDYLTKPIDSGLLRARVSRCIEAKRLRERVALSLARLRESERLRESLTSMIVHDLRTPLTSMLASVKTVAQLGATLTDERRARLLEVALRGGDTLVGMIDDLLDIAKLESGGAILATAPGDVADVIARARDQVAALADKVQVVLVVEVPGALPAVIDAGKLVRVVVNLLANAVKATDPGGTVTVAAAAGAAITITVRDTGRGIAPEHLGRIFEKFYQVAGGPKGASGLGLTFAKLVVEQHGGTIAVASELGAGTAFTIALPG